MAIKYKSASITRSHFYNARDLDGKLLRQLNDGWIHFTFIVDDFYRSGAVDAFSVGHDLVGLTRE